MGSALAEPEVSVHAPADYHTNLYSGVTASMLKLFSRDPYEFYCTYIATGPERLDPKEQTRALTFGTATHAYLLEPDRYKDRLYVGLPLQRRSNADKQAHADWAAQNAGKLEVSPDDWAGVKRCCENAWNHPTIGSIMRRPGVYEKVVTAQCPDTGLALKCLPDKLMLDGAMLPDVKTARDITPYRFGADCYNLGYYLQLGYYRYVVRLATGVDCACAWIVFLNRPPYHCAVYEPKQHAVKGAAIDVLDQAEQECRALLQDLARRLKSGDWAADWQVGVQPLCLPKWAFYPQGSE